MRLYEILLNEMQEAEQEANQKSLETTRIKHVLIHPRVYHELRKEEAEEMKKGLPPFIKYNPETRREITFFWRADDTRHKSRKVGNRNLKRSAF